MDKKRDELRELLLISNGNNNAEDEPKANGPLNLSGGFQNNNTNRPDSGGSLASKVKQPYLFCMQGLGFKDSINRIRMN